MSFHQACETFATILNLLLYAVWGTGFHQIYMLRLLTQKYYSWRELVVLCVGFIPTVGIFAQFYLYVKWLRYTCD